MLFFPPVESLPHILTNNYTHISTYLQLDNRIRKTYNNLYAHIIYLYNTKFHRHIVFASYTSLYMFCVYNIYEYSSIPAKCKSA